jgi:hypothetical protein
MTFAREKRPAMPLFEIRNVAAHYAVRQVQFPRCD